MYASVNWVVITLGLFCTKPLPEPILNYFRSQIRRNQVESERNSSNFHPRKCISKCRLQKKFAVSFWYNVS